MGEFGLHASDGSLEEESNEVFVCAIFANLLEGRDVGRTIFKFDDEQWMIGSKENEIGE